MKLSPEDAGLFFKLLWGLHFYVNQQRQVLHEANSLEAYVALAQEGKLEVRNALWENPELIDAYVAANPHGRSAQELEIIGKWKRFISGTFYIFRHLKKHTIFIGEDDKVYGVLGLHESLEEVLYGRPLPFVAQAVLLPFKGKIVYDGLLSGYNVFFGGGIRADLNETYMVAKQKDRIITTLEPELAEPAQQTRQKPSKDWRSEVDELVHRADQVKGGSPIQSSAYNLLHASARLAQGAAHNPEDLDALWQLERRVRTALTRLHTALNRAER